MTQPLTIVGLGGSLARSSRSLAALRIALDGAAAVGATTALLDLRELDLPMYDPDDEREPPPAASTLIEACYGVLQTTRRLSSQERARSRPSASSPQPSRQ